MAFSTDISYYAGSVTGKDAAITSFLRAGVKWVINQIEKTNPDLLPLFAQASTLSNSPTTLSLTTNSKIIDVVRNNADDGTAEALKCSPVNAAYRSNVVNTDSIYYAGKDSPVYYIDNKVLTVKPTPTATQTAIVSIVLPDVTVAFDGTSISNFPSELYHAVILFAAVQLLHNKMASMGALLPTDLDSDTTVFDAIADYSSTLSVSSSLPSAINMGSTALPSAISVSASLPSAISISSALPSALSITKSLPATISLSTGLPSDFSTSTSLPADFSLTADLPSAINMNSISPPSTVDVSTTLPTLSISTSIDSEYNDALGKVKALINVGLATDEASGSGDDATAQSAGYWLADEDEEMTQATIQVATQELQRASAWLQRFQASMGKETQQFEVNVSKYTTELQKETARVQADSQKHSDQLQKEMQRVANEAQIYSNEVQKETQEITSQLNKFQGEVQKETQRITGQLGKYQAELELKGQKTQTDVTIYTAEIQKESARLQAEATKYSSELQKESARVQNEASIYTTELTLKTSQMQQQVSAYTNLLGKETARVQNEATIYTTELQKESTRLQDDLSEYNANLQKKISLYTTIISKLSTDYQWLQSQYQVVKQELGEFMMPYTAPGMSDSTVERVRR